MAVAATNLGFPRMGPFRELKKALEAHWAGRTSAADLQATAATLRRQAWEVQRDHGLDLVPVGDFSLYDHVLDTAAMVGAVPDRYRHADGSVDLASFFAMARGGDFDGSAVGALEMTKWFDTNYHYLVPELSAGQRFALTSTKVVDELREATALGFAARPVLVGPISFLVLAKQRGGGAASLDLLPGLVAVYEEVLAELAAAGADWVQIDEPVLGLDLDPEVLQQFHPTYARLHEAAGALRLLVATYFTDLRRNLPTALDLPVSALHLDAVAGAAQVDAAIEGAPETLALSLGLIDGRNVWRSDLGSVLMRLQLAQSRLGSDRLIVAPSCSLLHLPVDLANETDLDPQLAGWLAFAVQRIDELRIVTTALNAGPEAVADELAASAAARADRRASSRVTDPAVQARVTDRDPALEHRTSPYPERRGAQARRLGLPSLPTTTIGSFPQTSEVRSARARHRRGDLDTAAYEEAMRRSIAEAVRFQEEVGLDVLVHGEPERNDMVEHFGALLDGCAVTTDGWVQSYGSRCVKPPVIYGDVSRPEPMTVSWASYAQSLTDRPVKGMLTGPVTILAWSFVRDDQPLEQTCRQIAFAIRDEVVDLEAAGIAVVQIDEPALRELLPLHDEDRPAYLEWAVSSFRLAASGVRDDTQIHTHMCYGEFADVIEPIAAFDADVISIEASRSEMELLQTFADFRYPNEIGPGVWDIHSPRVPDVDEMVDLLGAALEVLPAERTWVNPDCGLKTRSWDEVRPALTHLVEAAAVVRSRLAQR